MWFVRPRHRCRPNRRTGHPVVVSLTSWLVALAWGTLVIPAGATVDPMVEPRLIIEPAHLDLGFILDSEETTIPVVVQNRSEQPLEIADVVANLSQRISYDLEQSHLGPGEASLLQLYFDPEALQGDVQLMVAVIAGEATAPQCTLQVDAVVEPCYRIRGTPVAFAKVIQGIPQTWRIAVEPRIELAHPLDEVVSDIPGFTGTVRPDPAHGRFFVDIVASADLPIGLHQTVVSIQSSAGTAPICTIPVGATVHAPFQVIPDQLVLNRSPREQLRTIMLEHHVEPPLRVTGVEIPGLKCRYRINRGDGPFRTWLNLYFVNAQDPDVTPELIIHTNHPAHPTVSVPVLTQDVASVIVEPDCPQAKATTAGRTTLRRRTRP